MLGNGQEAESDSAPHIPRAMTQLGGDLCTAFRHMAAASTPSTPLPRLRDHVLRVHEGSRPKRGSTGQGSSRSGCQSSNLSSSQWIRSAVAFHALKMSEK